MRQERSSARALNVGSGLARCELVLWIDNDLLTPPPCIARAAQELNDRRLDYLIPYTSVRYLSEADSLAVMNGSRNPADCTPSRILYSGRRGPACSGGAGLVRREFLLRYGGLIEGFRGWGGEDNAWNRKVGMLGRAAPTTQADQHLYHLFHISSGGYLGHTASADNPQYTENLALLQRICAIRDSRQLLQQFPPRRSPPWSDACRIAVLTAPDAPDQASAGAVARALSSLYGDTVEEVLILPDNAWRERCVSADATVVFRKAAAWHAFGDGDASELRRRSVVVIDERDEAGIVAHFPSRHRILPLRMTPEHAIDPEQVAALLVGPLSLIVADASLDPEQPATIRVPRAQCLPVWTYWEGPCPDWIEACRRTIVKHAPDVRLLGPDDIDRLRDRDRDIGLSHLATAHRSDFMRAFLLARYGGLWIDSDCLVMKPLQPVLALLREHDFVAHRERSGYVSNGFIGARVGSRIARAFYARLCSILRLRQPLGWISLGGQPLTEILNRYVGCWYELECKKVQPICWSSPGVFFARGEPRTHEQRFDTEALCYMLSNTEITKRAIKHPADQLTDPDTFFSFVLNKALGDSRTIDASSAQSRLVHRPAAPVASLREIFAEFVAAYRRFGDESLSGPGSSMAQTAELRGRLPLLVADLGIQSLLDAPCGDFHWMREVELCLAEYIGVDFLEELVVENERRYGTPGRRFLCLDIREAPLPATDCVLCRDCLVHLSFADIYRTLRNFKSSRARYLFTTTFTSRRKNEDALDGAWRPLNFELPPFAFPKPLRLLNEKCSEAGGAFRDKSLGLWRLEDLPL